MPPAPLSRWVRAPLTRCTLSAMLASKASSHCRLLVVLLLATACAKNKAAPAAPAEPQPATASTETPPPDAAPAPAPEAEPAPAEPAAPSEPAAPDNSALVAALDAVEAAVEACHGKLGSKQAGECADGLSSAIAGLDGPVSSASNAGDLQAAHQAIKTHGEKLAKAAKGTKHKDQHHHLDAVAKAAKDLRSKI